MGKRAACHTWLVKHFGHEKLVCEDCGWYPGWDGRGECRILDFAYLGASGGWEYDRAMYAVLCRPCHNDFDRKART